MGSPIEPNKHKTKSHAERNKDIISKVIVELCKPLGSADPVKYTKAIAEAIPLLQIARDESEEIIDICVQAMKREPYNTK